MSYFERQENIQRHACSKEAKPEESRRVYPRYAKEKPQYSKQRKKAPNYFISLPITNPKIHQEIKTVQEAAVKSVPALAGACIKTPKLHVTLMVMHIDGEQQLQLGQKALQECQAAISELTDPPLILHVCGVSHFNNAVMYADLQDNGGGGMMMETLKQIVEKVRATFERKGISNLDERFTPHVTILNLSKLRNKGIFTVKQIPATAFEGFADKAFGEQIVERLKLCAMLEPKAEDGGYHVDGEIVLVSADMKVTVPEDMRGGVIDAVGSQEQMEEAITECSVPRSSPPRVEDELMNQ